MEFLWDNLGLITTVVGVVYPPALFVLPASTASKINVGVKVVKGIANALEKAEKTKGGLSVQNEEN